MLMFLLLAIMLVVLVPLNQDTTVGQIGREETTAVTIVSQNSIFKDNGLHMIGQIKNVGNKTLNFVKVIASFYNQRNESLGTEFAFLVPDEIIPNRVSNFEINFPSNNLQFKTINFYTLTVAWQNPDGSSAYSIIKPETKTNETKTDKPSIVSMNVSSNPLVPQADKNLSMTIPLQSRDKILLNRQPSPYPLKITYLGTIGSEGLTSGKFLQPASIEYSAANNMIYVSDLNNDRIQIFDSNGHFISSWDAPTYEFSHPEAIAADSINGFVYVSEIENNRIQKFDINGTFLGKWDSSGARVGQFDNPDGIAFDNISGFIYVSDRKNHRVLVFNEDGDSVYVLDLAKSTHGLVIKPRDIAIDSAGKLFVVDKVNSKIHVFSTKSSSQ